MIVAVDLKTEDGVPKSLLFYNVTDEVSFVNLVQKDMGDQFKKIKDFEIKVIDGTFNSDVRLTYALKQRINKGE